MFVLLYLIAVSLLLSKKKLSFDRICCLAKITGSKFARTDGFVRHLYVGSTVGLNVYSIITRSRCCWHRSVIGLLLRERPRIGQIELAIVRVSKLNPVIVRVIKVNPCPCTGTSSQLCWNIEPVLLEKLSQLCWKIQTTCQLQAITNLLT